MGRNSSSLGSFYSPVLVCSICGIFNLQISGKSSCGSGNKRANGRGGSSRYVISKATHKLMIQALTREYRYSFLLRWLRCVVYYSIPQRLLCLQKWYKLLRTDCKIRHGKALAQIPWSAGRCRLFHVPISSPVLSDQRQYGIQRVYQYQDGL